MKCPECKKKMQLIESYIAISGEHRLLFYCNDCDKALHTPIEFIELKFVENKGVKK